MFFANLRLTYLYDFKRLYWHCHPRPTTKLDSPSTCWTRSHALNSINKVFSYLVCAFQTMKAPATKEVVCQRQCLQIELWQRQYRAAATTAGRSLSGGTCCHVLKRYQVRVPERAFSWIEGQCVDMI